MKLHPTHLQQNQVQTLSVNDHATSEVTFITLTPVVRKLFSAILRLLHDVFQSVDSVDVSISGSAPNSVCFCVLYVHCACFF